MKFKYKPVRARTHLDCRGSLEPLTTLAQKTKRRVRLLALTKDGKKWQEIKRLLTGPWAQDIGLVLREFKRLETPAKRPRRRSR